MEEIKEATEYVVRKLEGYLKFKNISKIELATRWGKSEAYVYRRFSREVELSLTDILELCHILEIPSKEREDIFFGYELRNTQNNNQTTKHN